jgi:hypothetical protein
MAGARIIFPEFRDEQSDSRYPFSDDAKLKSTAGVQIPRDLFFDAALYVINASAPLYISSIAVGSVVTITIGDADAPDVAVTSYNPLTPPENGALEVIDSNGRPVGLLLGQKDILASLGGWEPIIHRFSKAATEFVPGVVIPAKEPGVRALTATSTAAFITGDVWLVGRQGVVFRETAPNTIRVDIVGVPLFKRALCFNEEQQPLPGVQFNPKTFLRTINGCGPDKFGNFTIAAAANSATDPTLRVYVEDAVLKVAAVATKVI